MACRYPDATSPRELWENAVAGRRAFRRLPDVRMRLEDYYDADPRTPDRFYARTAAVIEGYEFDRIAYKVAGSTYRSTDLTHWLALDVAATALADAGFPMAEGLPRERVGVIVGNSLTGEFSRANQLRLRWPFVRRMVAAALKEQDWDDEHLASFLDGFEATFKSPFPEIDEDTLAGGLSNTIAGRICNHFDLKGGGYTVDGACSSSLLSVATACKGLVDGELDVVVAGGVDLSIDPFEIIGFAKTGALARGEMRVYDKAASGFWPGEGCGMVVLMREDDARKAGHRIYTTVAGWGISSDGKGGITRPEVSGYRLALRRAYERAGFGIETIALFEGHGTGTPVGDATELRALSLARKEADANARPAVIGSVKAMIGHTKAAAGVAGLIKAAMAVHHRVLPPAIGCVDPHELLTEPGAPLRVLRKAEPFPDRGPARAGVTAMGFGGINTHIVLDNDAPRRRTGLDTRMASIARSLQDVELLVVDAASVRDLRDRIVRVADFVLGIAYGQLSDLALTLHDELRDLPYRAAVVVSSPEDAERKLRDLIERLDAGETSAFAADGRALLGHAAGPGRIGFLFPGQGSGRSLNGGALRRRFAEAEEVYRRAALPTGADAVATEVAQPRIVTGSLAGLRVLNTLGIEAIVAVGHSLGEISALHWAGALGEATLLEVAAARGAAMSQHSASGTMASIGGAAKTVDRLLSGLPVVIAGFNGPHQTVVAGAEDAVEAVCARAHAAGLAATRLPVSHAFHSPLIAPAAGAFATTLRDKEFTPLERRVVSTITGEPLPSDVDLRALLHRQITDPVRFSQAVDIAAKEVDLFVEVGPGRVLSGLAAGACDVPVVALDTDDESLAGLLSVVAAAFVLNAARVDAGLFHGRMTRPLQVGKQFRFFASPCESAPQVALPASRTAAVTAPAQAVEETGESTTELLRRLAAERAELPLDLVRDDSRLLDDLHLSSITVGQVVNQVAGRLGVAAAQAPTNFATATVKELADTLAELAANGGGPQQSPIVAGAAPWARPWSVDLDEVPRPARAAVEDNGEWRVYAGADNALAEPLRRRLQTANVGSGVLVCLPEGCTPAHIESALLGAKAALSGSTGGRFVLVQHDRGAAGLAKTLRLEGPQLKVTIVHAPPIAPAVGWIAEEVAATSTFAEAFYDADGVRRVPTLRVLPIRPHRTEELLAGDDVLLVTGGGKGITAECALSLATASGASLGLIGRSDPDGDLELAANLARFSDRGVTARYAQADVTDAAQVAAAVAKLTAELGPVTAVLHGAGRNEPASLSTLDMAEFDKTFAPKIGGLRAVLAAVEPERLKLLVTLGSIIGRAGLRGEAHYATANEWLADETLRVGRDHPQCRALCLEWSVWSGVGMGERLSVVESLTRDGVTPITPDQGIDILRRLVTDPDAPAVTVISGRTEGIDTVRYDRPELPLLRFVERPLIRYHGVELVSQVQLSAGTDLYLPDHLLDGNMLFPAVFGMEAMAQVALATTGRVGAPVIEQAQFLRPIVVPPSGRTTIRIACVVTGHDTVEVAIHSEETAYAADHFRARLRLGASAAPDGPPEMSSDGTPPVALDPATDLYGPILFQGPRFQRLRTYHRAAARAIDVDLAADRQTSWFAGHLPTDLLLGDPGVRDAMMHGNQVCVPDATLLPQGIERIHPAGPAMFDLDSLRCMAVERSRDGDTYVYDVVLRDGAGVVFERWEGLSLRAVRKNDASGPWAAPLIGPYLERALGDLIGAEVAVTVEPDETSEDRGDFVAQRRARTALAASRSLGRPASIVYRNDGRPEIAGGDTVSSSHASRVTLCVTGKGPLGCDVESVDLRATDVWPHLLGAQAALADLVAGLPGENRDSAGTRVWAALECLQKTGHAAPGPLTLQQSQRPGWVVFAFGGLRIATFRTTLRGAAAPVVFAVLTEGRD